MGLYLGKEKIGNISVGPISTTSNIGETWVISNKAPVDDTIGYYYNNCKSNGKSYKGIALIEGASLVDSEGIEHKNIGLRYMILNWNDGDTIGYAIPDLGQKFNFKNEAQRIITFETAPTGDLLTWLQKNADKVITSKFH